MNLSLKKYFSFGYRDILVPLVRHGVYSLDTYDDQDNRIITTTFYLDGDVQNMLYMSDDDRLLAEYNEEKVVGHMAEVEKRVLSLDAFYAQIQAVVVFITGLITYLIAWKEQGPLAGAGITVGISAAVIFLKKYWFKVFSWLIQKIVVPMIQNY
jgi:hypothetical protein